MAEDVDVRFLAMALGDKMCLGGQSLREDGQMALGDKMFLGGQSSREDGQEIL
ncbi:unnamed protein product [Dovyalis caffra]|uniref:Uncharacterized protein n=1 Tax=Dovyalis caffra TaxID=77055 RepID=A0AAV1RMY7_9ROSI|nr:unnamed protein product [Dovyalis caffra]